MKYVGVDLHKKTISLCVMMKADGQRQVVCRKRFACTQSELIRKFFAEVTLLEQPWVRDESKTIQQLVDEASKAAGAPLTVRRFVRYRMGE